MRASERLQTTLPDDIDEESKNGDTRQQTIDALSASFRKCVKAKGASDKPLENVIHDMSVKDINDIFFDDPVPNAPGRCYNEIIEAFLAGPDLYKENFEHIIEGYMSIVHDLQERIQGLLINGKTDEADEKFKTSTATYLDARLTSICERTKLVISVHRDIERIQNRFSDISQQVSENGELGSKVHALESTIDNLNNTIYGEENGERALGIKSIVDQLSKKVIDIHTTSDQIMPNIISLMGVFSSVIVVILSLITTSSTWLSNANETDVLIAFVVPAGIITLAICALSALVRSLLDTPSIKNTAHSEDSESQPASLLLLIKQALHKWGPWLFISIITFLIVCSTIRFSQKKNDDQIHYIVKCQPTLEPRDDSNDDETQTTLEASGQELFIVQEIILPTGERYQERIPCDESNKHSDGFVYYCLFHQQCE